MKTKYVLIRNIWLRAKNKATGKEGWVRIEDIARVLLEAIKDVKKPKQEAKE